MSNPLLFRWAQGRRSVEPEIDPVLEEMAHKESIEKPRPRPYSWVLLLVQLAERWQAAALVFEFPEGGISVEIQGAGARQAWLEEAVSGARSGQVSKEPEAALLQKAVAAALAAWERDVVLVATSPGAAARAVRMERESAEWGEAELAEGHFLIQFRIPREGDVQSRVQSELRSCCCSDMTVSMAGEEVSGFLPVPPRDGWTQEDDPALHLGLWGVTGGGGRIRLGRSFAGTDARGVERRELTFGTFRTGLLGEGDRSKAGVVVAFTHHGRPVESCLVSLRDGVLVGQTGIPWKRDRLALTVYAWADGEALEPADSAELPLPEMKLALEAMIKEYNAYSPRIETSTLGCWLLLGLGSLALAGLAAPLFGSGPSFILGSLLALGLMIGEFRYRGRARFEIGKGLERLASAL